MQDRPPPIADSLAPRNVAESVVDHLADLVKETERVSRKDESHSPFTRSTTVWIELAELEVAEQRLDRRGIVAVGARENDRQPEPVDDALRLAARVMRRIVPEEHRVALPAWLLLVQGRHHVLQE